MAASRTEPGPPETLAVTLTVGQLRSLVADAVAEALAELVPAEAQSDLLTRTEAARFLRCSLTQLDRLCRDGGLPFHLLGDSRRFVRSELLEYVAASARSQQTETPASVPEDPAT